MKTRGRAPATELEKTDNHETVTPMEAAAGIVQAAAQDLELVVEEAKDAAHAAFKRIRKAVPSAAASKKPRARARKPAAKKIGRRAKSASKKAGSRKNPRGKRRS